MNENEYYTECKFCIFEKHETIACAVSKLSLALHKMCKEVPVLTLFADDVKTCECFIDKTENHF